jgi:hypothetical protein
LGLSDACFDFGCRLQETRSDAARREAVEALRQEIEFYSKPPFRYGEELSILAAVCAEYIDGRTTSNADPIQRIMFLADAIRDQLDMPPNVTRILS